MSKIKFIITLFFSFPIAAFVAALFILDNPDTYRDLLTKRFHEETQLNLTIDGDINWRYWPPIAMEISGISITPDNKDTSLATLESARIDIKLLPLITGGRILIDEIHIDGISINAVIDKQGRGNWEPASSITQASGGGLNNAPKGNLEKESGGNSGTNSGKSSNNNLDLDITEFEIEDAKIRYQDLRDGSDYLLDVTAFTTNTLKPDYPAEINLVMTVEDKSAQLKIDTQVTGTLSFNKRFDQFRLNDFSIKNTLSQKDSSKIDTKLMLNGLINTTKGTANLDNGTLSLATMTLNFSLNATNILGTPGIKGDITIPEFNALPLLEALDIPLSPMQDSNALKKLSLKAQFKGTTNQIVMDNLVATLDKSNIKGRIVATIAPSLSVEFALNMDTINLSDYLEIEGGSNTAKAAITNAATTNTAPSNAAPSNTSTSTPPSKAEIVNSDSEVIPVSMLSEIQLDGSLDIDNLVYDSYQFNKVRITALNQQEGFRLNAKMTGYGGEFALQTQLRNIDPASEPTGKTRFIIKDVDISQLTELNAITGTLAMDSTTSFNGNMLSEVLDSLDGDSNFTVSNGTLNVEAIKGIAKVIEGLQGKTSSISTWPDQLPFKILQGKHRFDEGVLEGQQFSFEIENMAVIGSGGLDYFANTLNYDIEATLKENVGGQFTVNKNLADIRWPLHCEGTLDATATELCLADKGAITKIVGEIAKQAVRRQGEEKLLEKVPDEYKDAAKALLKGLFN